MIKAIQGDSKAIILKQFDLIINHATNGEISKISNGMMILDILIEPFKDETYKKEFLEMENQYKEIAQKIEIEQKTIKTDVTPLINHYIQEKNIETFKIIASFIIRRL